METGSNYKTSTAAFRQQWIEYIYGLQETICAGLEAIDGKAKFIEDNWERSEGRGGGGKTKVISHGQVFEKGGVNTSVVYGHVKEKMKQQLQVPDAAKWFAAGLSLVLHPLNPFVPTVHANWRYFELYDASDNVCDRWFGGGTDLTPYYLFDEDAKHFHLNIKNTMSAFGEDLYATYKQRCDEYFVNSHRNHETRGIGGVFYDHLRPENDAAATQLKSFQEANGNSFLKGYLPIVEKRKDMLFGDKEKHWQEIRRGRYVEFNLLHDRGTLFGLKTNGRTESILMSLPPTVRFEYNYQPAPGTEEERLVKVCLQPKDWVNV